MKTPQNRIDDLEQALRSAIAYLRRLPSVPATTAQADVLQHVLDDTFIRPVERAKVCEHITPAGIPLMRAELHGDELLLSSRTPRLTEAKLIQMLRSGSYVMNLKQLDRSAPLTEREKARKEEGIG